MPIRELKQALEENANNENANYFLGSLLVQENRYDEGVPYLERARKLKPDSWAVCFYLGKAELRLRHTAEAVALSRGRSELNPDEGAAHYQLGRALEASGQKAAAARAFKRARELKADELKAIKIPGVQ